MRKARIFKLVFLFSLVGFLLLGYLKNALAGYIPIDDEPCTSDQECNQRYGTEGMRCLSIGSAGKQCYQFVQPTSTGSFQKFTQTIETARQSGTMPRERWVGDPAGSILSDTVNGITALIVGTGGTGSPTGALNSVSNYISFMITNPVASDKEYLADLGQNLGIIKTANAQGIGFTKMSNLLPLWKASRNIAYFFFVIVFIAIGLAIMLRLKIDPKTVITIQNAIPKLIIALILITFSYAIVGFLIDLVYVFLYLGALLLAGYPGGPGSNILEAQNNLANLNFGTLAWWGLGLTWKQSLLLGLFGIKTDEVGHLLFNVISGIITIVAPAPLNLIGIPGSLDGLLTAILSIIVLLLVVKLFFSLVVTYMSIIISTIFAPLILMIGAMPGSKSTFGDWIKTLLSNILIFPAVAIFFFIIQILIQSTGPSWVPPALGVEGSLLPTLIGLGGLLLINKIPDIIKGYFAGKPFTAYGSAIGQNFSVITKPTGAMVEGVARDVEKVAQDQHAPGGILTAPIRFVSDNLNRVGR